MPTNPAGMGYLEITTSPQRAAFFLEAHPDWAAVEFPSQYQVPGSPGVFWVLYYRTDVEDAWPSE